MRAFLDVLGGVRNGVDGQSHVIVAEASGDQVEAIIQWLPTIGESKRIEVSVPQVLPFDERWILRLAAVVAIATIAFFVLLPKRA